MRLLRLNSFLTNSPTIPAGPNRYGLGQNLTEVPLGADKERRIMSSLSLRLSLLAGVALFALFGFALAGCGGDADTSTSGGTAIEDNPGQTGTAGTNVEAEASNDPNVVLIDGSSTVWPVSMAMGEKFKGASVKVNAASGTSGGFKKFVVGKTDINDASRRIKQKEIDACKDNGIDPLELTVAIDGISIVVNKENTWCDHLTFAQLKALWEPDSKVKTWKDLNSEWPDEKISLFGPDNDSGTFEYFTEKVIELKKQCRDDYTPAVNDNVLVTGVAGDKFALGYFGYGYYDKARKQLKGLNVAKGDGPPVTPSAKTIESYEYPLARPVFIYVNKSRLTDKGMPEFLRFYLGDGQKLVSENGCVRLSADVLAESVAALEAALSESK